MPFPLRPQETAFYPQPFVETEVNLLVITNQRVVQFGDEGKQEMEAREVGFVGRVSERPLLVAGIVAAFVGLLVLLTGVFEFATAKGPLQAPAGVQLPAVPAIPGVGAPPPAAVNDDPAAQATDDPASPPAEAPKLPTLSDGMWQRVGGALAAVVGLALMAAGALLAGRQRHIVLVRGGSKVMKLKAASKMEQAQILSTLQAVQTAGKAQAAPPAPAAKPKLVVDDKGDPVKALQELAAARQAGKVPEEEFLAKREILLERVRSRK